MVEMDRKHELEHHEMHSRHMKAHHEMHTRHMEERHKMHARQEQEVAAGQTQVGAGEQPGGGAPVQSPSAPNAGAV